MKKLFTLFALLGAMLVTMNSCTKNYNYNYEIENVTVQFGSKELLNTVVSSFSKMASTKSSSSLDSEYEHIFPSTYKAYFVSKETKGEWKKGDLVRVLNVSSGMNTITIPKLDYDIYVTNFEKEGQWYTWNNAIEQLPQTTPTLYLYGKNSIDYSKVVSGTVELVNPYAGIMIKKNQYINGIPTSYDTNQPYSLVHNDTWFLLYSRNGNTNTKIPISIAGNYNTHYTLSKKIESNKIYQYTIDGSVDIINDGNLSIIVSNFEKVIKETIKL